MIRGAGTIIKLGGGGEQKHQNQKSTYLQIKVYSRISTTSFWKYIYWTKTKFHNIFKAFFSQSCGSIALPPLSTLEGQLPPPPPLFLRLCSWFNINLKQVAETFHYLLLVNDSPCCASDESQRLLRHRNSPQSKLSSSANNHLISYSLIIAGIHISREKLFGS